MHSHAVCLGIVALLGCVVEPAPTKGEGRREPSGLISVPPPVREQLPQCGARKSYFDGTAIRYREEWYGAHLGALGEPVLCRDQGGPREIYRLIWLPSFHPSVIVRVERDLTEYRLQAKIESGAGGYEPGHLVRDTIRVLSDAERDEHLSLDLGSLPPGRYRLAIVITDMPSGRSAARKRDIHVSG